MTKDLGFRMSRHIILFSMPLSELVHTLPVPICHFISKVFKSGIDTTHCLVLGEIAMKFETENACDASFYGHGNESKDDKTEITMMMNMHHLKEDVQ